MSTDGASTKLFLSYSRDAATFAQAVAAALEEKGFAAWTDRGFVNDEDFEERLRRELDRSEWVVVLISSEALRSPNVNFEIGAAFAQDKHVLLEQVDLVLDGEHRHIGVHQRERRVAAGAVDHGGDCA